MVSTQAWALAADDVERVHEAIIGLVWDSQHNEQHWKALIKEVGSAFHEICCGSRIFWSERCPSMKLRVT